MCLNVRKLILVFIIIINSYAIENESQTGPLDDQESISLRRGLDPTNSMSSSSSGRFRRNVTDDKLKDSIEKLEMISRLTNVIYLQQGLSNGSVFESEKLISELLHFGSVKPSDILSLDLEKIEKAFDSLKNLPSTLQDASRIETVFEFIGKTLVEMKGISKAAKWAGEKDYEKNLEGLKKGNVDLSAVDNIKKYLKQWKSPYDSLIQLGEKGPTDKLDLTYLRDIKNAAQSLKDYDESSLNVDLFKFSNGPTAGAAIKVFVRVGTSVNAILENSLNIDAKDFKPIETNAQLIITSISQMTEVRPQLQKVIDLYISILYPTNSTSSEYTPGLPNGYDDVGKVASAFNNEWIKVLIRNSSLEQSYRSVQSLGSGVSLIQKYFGAPDSKPFETILRILEDAEKLKAFDKFPIEQAKEVAKCVNGFSKTNANSELVDGLKGLAESIDSELKRMMEILTDASKILKEQESNLATIISKVEKTDGDDLNSIKKTYKELMDGGLLTTVHESFSKMKLDDLNNQTLIDLATQSLNHLKNVDSFQDSSSSIYGAIDCLLGIKEAPKVINALKESKILRSDQSNYAANLNDGLRFVKAVVNTKDGLTSFQSSIRAAKGFTSLESGLLNLLSQADVHSKLIGLPTRGVVNMKLLLDRKSDFDVFKTHSKLVENEVNKHSKNLNPEELVLLKSLAVLGDSLDAIYSELDAWNTVINGLNFTKLEDYSDVFIKAKEVKGLTEDYGKMKDALGTLIALVEADGKNTRRKRSSDDLRKVKTALIALNELQFSENLANADKAKDSLSTLDSFFIEYAKAEIVKRSPPIQPPVITKLRTVTKPSVGGDALQKETNDTTTQKVLKVVGCCVLLFIAVLIVLDVPRFCCRKKKRVEEKSEIEFPIETVRVNVFNAVLFIRRFLNQLDVYGRAHPDEIEKFLDDNNLRKVAGGEESSEEEEESDEEDEEGSADEEESSDEEEEGSGEGSANGSEQPESQEPDESRKEAGGDDDKTVSKVEKVSNEQQEPSTQKTQSIAEEPSEPKAPEEPNAPKEVSTISAVPKAPSVSNPPSNAVASSEPKTPTNAIGLTAHKAPAGPSQQNRASAATNPASQAPAPVIPKATTAKSRDRLAAELKAWSHFQFVAVDGDLKENMMANVSDFVQKTHLKETREPVELRMENRLIVPTGKQKYKPSFPSDYFHGNFGKFRNGLTVLTCQGPRVVPITTKGKEKISNVEKFYFLVIEHGISFILMLCDFEEMGKPKCDKYIPLNKDEVLRFTGFSVKCTNKAAEGNVIKRNLVIVYDGKGDFKVIHYQYVGWPDKSVPETAAEYAKLWAEIRMVPAPVLIHCSAGIGQTGTTLLVEEIYQAIYYSNKTGIVDFGVVFRNIRRYRARAVQTDAQFIFAIMVVFEMCFGNVEHEERSDIANPDPNEEMEKVSFEDYQSFLALREAWKVVSQVKVAAVEQKEDKKVTESKGSNDKDRETKKREEKKPEEEKKK